MIRGYAFTGIYYVLSAACVLLALPLLLIPGRAGLRWLIRQYTLSIRFALRWAGGVRTEVRGRENLPSGPFIVAAKHQSWGDGFLVYPEVRNIVFVTGDHLEKFPFVGGILRKLGAIVIDTCGGGDRKAKSLARGMETARSAGQRILIYPEGHLAPPGHHFRYKAGVWHMQKEMDVPVVPVATNLGCFWQQQDVRKKPGTATIQFLQPIAPGQDKASFLAQLTQQVEEASQSLIAEARDAPATPSILLADPVKGALAQPVAVAEG